MPRIDARDYLTEDNLLRLEGWARDGLTDKQIAEKKIGISERAFSRWKKEYPSIYSALKKGKEPVDRKVENTLLKRALGYDYEEVVVEITEDEQGRKTTHRKQITKHALPDVTAQIYWLNNRMPEKWRNKREITDTAANDKLDMILDSMEKNELQRQTN